MVSPAACDCGLSGHQDVPQKQCQRPRVVPLAPCAGEPEGEAVRRRGQGADGRCRDRPTGHSQKGAGAAEGAPQSPDAPPAPRPARGGLRPLPAGPPLGAASASAGGPVCGLPARGRGRRQPWARAKPQRAPGTLTPRGAWRGPRSLFPLRPGTPSVLTRLLFRPDKPLPCGLGRSPSRQKGCGPPETLRSSGGRGSLPLFRALLRLGGKPRVCSPRAPRFARFAELLLLGQSGSMEMRSLPE